MLKSLVFASALILSAVTLTQDDCSGKAKDCKYPVANPHRYPERGCTCFTCEYKTAREKVICTRDDDETRALVARAKEDENAIQIRDQNDKKVKGK